MSPYRTPADKPEEVNLDKFNLKEFCQELWQKHDTAIVAIGVCLGLALLFLLIGLGVDAHMNHSCDYYENDALKDIPVRCIKQYMPANSNVIDVSEK